MSEKQFTSVLKEQKESFQTFVVGELSKQEKRFEGKLVEQKEDFKNYTGALAEKFERDLGLVAEGVSDLRKKTERLVTTVDYIAELVARNTEDIEIIKSDTEFIKHGLKRKIDIEEFMALEKRVLKLEKAVARN